MILNEGAADRVVRLVVAVAAVLFSWWAGFSSAGGILLLVFGGWMFVTGAVGVRPGYWLVKISTRPSPHRIATRGFRVAPHH